MVKTGQRLVALAMVMSMGVVVASPALAASGGGLPWEAPLQQIQQSITGPVAGFIALTAVAIAGGMLIFGGELNDFARRLSYIVLVAGILLGSAQIIALFGTTGASIGGNTRGNVATSQPSTVDAVISSDETRAKTDG